MNKKWLVYLLLLIGSAMSPLMGSSLSTNLGNHHITSWWWGGHHHHHHHGHHGHHHH